jgi:hypothetical protein
MYGGRIGWPELIVVVFIVLVTVLPFAKLFQKTGRSGWWGLCMLVPLVNLAVLLWFANSKWPIEVELERLRRIQGS